MDRTETEKILSEGTSNPQYQVALNMAKEKGWLNDRNTTDAKMPVEETKEEKKKRKQEEKAKKEEATRQWMLDRADVQNAARRSQIANPSVGVVDRVMGNVTGRNEDLLNPNAVKAKDLNADGSMANKNFQLGNGVESDFIGEEEIKKENKNSSDNNTGSVSNYDKNFLNNQAEISDYQKNNEMEKARKSELEGWNDINKTIEQSQKTFKNIDDHYLEQIPTFAAKRYFNGEFGDPKSSDAKLRLAHFMINGLQSKLKTLSNLAMANAGKSPMFADTTSDYEKLQNSNLEQGITNRWNKYKQDTDAAAALATKQGIEAQDVKNALNKIAANANMQSAFNMMNEKQKVYAIKVISEIGDKIKDFNRDDVTNFLMGALVSDKNFNSQDLLAAMGVKLGTDVLDSDTAKNVIEKIKQYYGNK